jgi:hypothetical protein
VQSANVLVRAASMAGLKVRRGVGKGKDMQIATARGPMTVETAFVL